MVSSQKLSDGSFHWQVVSRIMNIIIAEITDKKIGCKGKEVAVWNDNFKKAKNHGHDQDGQGKIGKTSLVGSCGSS